MAPISFLYVSILTPIFLALLSTFPAPAAAQDVGCLGYAGLPGEGNQCYIDPSTGTIMEAGVVAVGNCSDITLIATAIYTGIDAAVTAVASPEQDVGPEQNYEYADAFLYFDFPVPYEDVQDGSLVTFVVSYEFPGVTGRLAAGSSTVNKISTLVYTAATDTVIITADATTTLSSTTTSVITATVTPATTLIQTSPGPITTVTAKQPTTTTTVTITPAVSTRTHTVHTVTTTTLTCLGASSPSSSPAPTNRRLLNRPRGQTAGAPELLYCYTPGPNTTTIVTSAAVTTSTVTVTDTDVFFVGTTSQTTVTAPAPVSYKSGKGARTTVTPSSATSTKIMTAKASTVTVTSTSVRTVTALPSGKRTPKCPTSPVALVGAAITPTALMTVSA